MDLSQTATVIRVEAANVEVAYRFATRLMPHLAALRGRECRAAFVGAQPMCGRDILFSDIDHWSYGNAVNRTSALMHDGVNLIVLGPGYLDWASPGRTINDDLYALEDYLADHAIDVITIEAHADTWGGSFGLQAHFDNLSETAWLRRRLRMILGVMMSNARGGGLISPYGQTPCFLLDPEATDPDELHGTLRLLACFPSETYADARRTFGRYKSPFMLRSLRMGFPELKYGPMPAEVGI